MLCMPPTGGGTAILNAPYLDNVLDPNSATGVVLTNPKPDPAQPWGLGHGMQYPFMSTVAISGGGDGLRP